MDSMIALLIFFTFLYIIEKITEKREKIKEQQQHKDAVIEEVFSDNCPYCNRKVTYLENICGNCRQELKWE